MTRIKMHIFNVKLPFYPSCEVKYGLQNKVSTAVGEPQPSPWPYKIGDATWARSHCIIRNIHIRDSEVNIKPQDTFNSSTYPTKNDHHPKSVDMSSPVVHLCDCTKFRKGCYMLYACSAHYLFLLPVNLQLEFIHTHIYNKNKINLSR